MEVLISGLAQILPASIPIDLAPGWLDLIACVG